MHPIFSGGSLSYKNVAVSNVLRMGPTAYTLIHWFIYYTSTCLGSYKYDVMMFPLHSEEGTLLQKCQSTLYIILISNQMFLKIS